MAQEFDSGPNEGRGGGIRLPHSVQAEESLLGAMLLSSQAVGAATERVHAADFYKPAHGHIFEAISALYAAGEPVDTVTVAEELRRAELLDHIGGPSTLLRLQSLTPAVTSATHYATIVEENALLRRLISAAGEVAELGYHPLDDVSKTLDSAEGIIYDVAQRRVADTMAPLRDLLDDTIDRLDRLSAQNGEITGTPSGYQELDELLNGLQPNALIVTGARPAMGKTAFALGIAANAAIRADKPVLFFSLEMSQLELTQRILCMEARLDATKVRNGKMSERDWTKLTAAITRLAEAPLWIDDNPNVSIMEIRAKARRLKSKLGDLGLIVVDYLQLMSGRGRVENRVLEIAEISRGLKILARELQVPVLALSQLSRALELRSDKRPMLADLRESGSIEQDADVVIFLYRDEVYNHDSQDAGTAEVIVAKHRAGPTKTCRLAFLDYCTQFANMAHE
jgi:replicative DNA helicase